MRDNRASLSAFSDGDVTSVVESETDLALSRFRSQERPRAVLLAGQPGAGKTRLSSLAVSLMDGNAAFINADDYRHYHPGYRALYTEFGSDYVALTGAFSGAVTERLIQRLSEHHLNLVVEGTGRTVEVPRHTAELLTAKGYAVELGVIAARPEVSLCSTLLRFYQMNEGGTIPRSTAVPAHDERDWDFAKKFGLPIVEVVAGSPVSVQEAVYPDVETGTLVNSDFLDGLSVADAKKKIIEYLENNGLGTSKTNYKLRDWVFSRQRYWGEPIPIVKCEKCGFVPIDESELPLMLPEVESYEPTDNGDSPLASMTDWVNTTCPHCGGPAKRETDTMPQWAGSSWYFLRYTDPKNEEAIAGKEALEYWMPVDWYNGGMEHTTLHLLYSRFWHRFLYDQKDVPCAEPYRKRTSHGMILGSNGEKMSKSRGNVVNPDDIVREYGADTLRCYEMFIGAFDLSAAWSEDGVKGCRRFLERVWKLQDMLVEGDGYSASLETKMHQTIKKVSGDFENLKYNTAIAAMMSLINEFYKKNEVTKGEFKTLLALLNPVAPHITEELWQEAGYEGRLYETTWPVYEEARTVESMTEIGVQVNGKIRVTISVPKDQEKDAIIAAAKEALGDKLTGNIVKEIYVPGRIVNIVVK